MRLRLACLCLLPLFAGPAAAQLKLQWHFKPGEQFVLERVYRQKQDIEVKDRSLKHETTNRWTLRLTVKEKHLTHWDIRATFEEVVCKDGGAIPPAAFDEKLAARLKGLSLVLHVNGQGEVKKIVGYDNFLTKLSEGKRDAEKVVHALFSEEGLHAIFEEVFAFLPPKTAKRGESWKRETVDPVPPFGSFKTQLRYSYEGERDGLHAIDFTTRTVLQKSSEKSDLFRVLKTALTGEEGRGTYLFDPIAGRLVRGERAMTLRGELTVEAAGVTTTMRFVSQNELKLSLRPVK
ncbi:MAG: DUF6263 family protein [Gemmataceae bacterium]